jgi:hypothetical protein
MRDSHLIINILSTNFYYPKDSLIKLKVKCGQNETDSPIYKNLEKQILLWKE